MNLDIGLYKSAQVAGDGSLSIYQGSNIIFLTTGEAQKFKHWLNEVI